MSGIGNFMLAMNAHINRDFPNVIAEVGLTGPDGTSHKPDHNAYNPRLDALYAPVFAEMAARFDPTFDDLDLGPFDEAFVGGVMRGWREAVWRHAESHRPRPHPARACAGEAADRGVRRVPGRADPDHVRLAGLLGARRVVRPRTTAERRARVTRVTSGRHFCHLSGVATPDK